jgi:hypothetical protein
MPQAVVVFALDQTCDGNPGRVARIGGLRFANPPYALERIAMVIEKRG